MKKVLWGVYVIAFVVIPKNIHAQPVTVIAYHYIDTKNSITSNVPLNELNAKANRHFEKTYRDIDKETWTKIPCGTLVTFISNAAFCKIFYNTEGDFVYSYKYYDQKNCSAELTEMIGHAYPGYKMVNVVELFDGNKPVYGINISNGKLTKSLEMKNAELKVLNEFSNQ
jgi:hypothetical protein